MEILVLPKILQINTSAECIVTSGELVILTAKLSCHISFLHRALCMFKVLAHTYEKTCHVPFNVDVR